MESKGMIIPETKERNSSFVKFLMIVKNILAGNETFNTSFENVSAVRLRKPLFVRQPITDKHETWKWQKYWYMLETCAHLIYYSERRRSNWFPFENNKTKPPNERFGQELLSVAAACQRYDLSVRLCRVQRFLTASAFSGVTSLRGVTVLGGFAFIPPRLGTNFWFHDDIRDKTFGYNWRPHHYPVKCLTPAGALMDMKTIINGETINMVIVCSSGIPMVEIYPCA